MIEFEDPFEALTSEQISDLALVARVRRLLAEGGQVDEIAITESGEVTQRLEEAGVDIDGLLAKRSEITRLRTQRASAVREELNGLKVRMPGYVLPLQFSGTRTTEFLLVPWVGACIHTPPPPPNQIVYVKIDNGIEIEGQFTPIWVIGEMRVKATTNDLFLVDGSAGIDAGYVLAATKVEPYNK